MLFFDNNLIIALHLAARHSCEDLVKVLLCAGVNINHKDDKNGSTPLHEAVKLILSRCC